MRNRASLLGYSIDTFSFDEAVNYAENISGQVITINPEMLSNPDLQDIVNSAELVIPDGVGVQIGLKLIGKDVKRIPGIQFAYRMLQECAKNNQPVALVGAKPEVIEKAAQNLNSEIENLNIVYLQDGYFEDDDKIISELKSRNPRLILCALGSPKQEFFIKKAKEIMTNSLFIGVGGSFDVWAGTVERAPEIWQKCGLEWLYRTIKEPKRFRRIFPTLPLFVLRVLKEKFIPKGV